MLPILLKRSYTTSQKGIQYFSDVHLEFRKDVPKFKAKAPYLAICGDLGNPFHKSYQNFLKNVSSDFDKVFVVAGNHEYWQNHRISMDVVDEQIHSLCNQKNNLHFMKNSVFTLDEKTKVVGTTLWSNIVGSLNYLSSDYKNISINGVPFSWKIHNRLHHESVKFLEGCIDDFTECKLLVLTHHLPSYKLIVDFYKKQKKFKGIQDRWASDLDYLLSDQVSGWICGHSHCQLDKVINGTPCYINSQNGKLDSIPTRVCYL